MKHEWKVGKRDIWAPDGSRVAEVVCQDWKGVCNVIAAAPELLVALEEMLEAFATARDITNNARILNARRCHAARVAIAKARGK